MRLPTFIEREIQEIEGEYNARPGQHAGTIRLKDLRWAIEKYMKDNELQWDSPMEDSIYHGTRDQWIDRAFKAENDLEDLRKTMGGTKDGSAHRT